MLNLYVSALCWIGIGLLAMASSTGGEQAFAPRVAGVRYQVKDVDRSVAFYTQHLGFTLEHQQLPAFASVSLGHAQILLSGPGASGSSRSSPTRPGIPPI